MPAGISTVGPCVAKSIGWFKHGKRGADSRDVPGPLTIVRLFVVALFLVFVPSIADAAATEGHSLSQKAVEIARPFGFPITNSMVVTWLVAAGLIVFAQLATRNMKQVPEGPQNFLEWLVEGLYGFLEGLLGSPLAKQTFWFFGTVFIFILAANWVGLIPGVGSMGWGHQTAGGFRIE